MERPILVLDFDGTVCLGDDPVLAYADAVLAELPQPTATRIRGELTGFLSGRGPEFLDGYDAVRRLSEAHVGDATFDAAYAASRQRLADGTLRVHAPAGLAGLLADLSGTVRPVVVTNAPITGLEVTLERIGLAAVIDDLVPSAGKPDGWQRLFERLLGTADPARLLSIGDVWPNDIAPPLAAGCATGFVHHGRGARPAHVGAPRIQDLYPDITAWAADPAAWVRERSGRAPRPATDNPEEITA